MRKTGATVLLVAGAATAFALLRRPWRGQRDHVDLYFADGSTISFAEGSAEGDRLLGLGRDVIAAAHA